MANYPSAYGSFVEGSEIKDYYYDTKENCFIDKEIVDHDGDDDGDGDDSEGGNDSDGSEDGDISDLLRAGGSKEDKEEDIASVNTDGSVGGEEGALSLDDVSEDEEEHETTSDNDLSVMNDDETDSADEEDTSILAKVDTTIVHTNLDIPEMAALIHQVCAEPKQPDRELTVVHYVAVDQVNDLDNLCNAIELSNLKLPCRHTLVQQCVEGEMLLANNTSRLSAMLQLLFRADENDVVIFEHVDFEVGSILDPDDYRSLAYSFNGEHNQSKQQQYLSTRGDIIMCNAVFEEFKGKQNVENWRMEWTAMKKERQKTQVLSNWSTWGEVMDWFTSKQDDYCLSVQTLNNALQKDVMLTNFLQMLFMARTPIL